MLVNFNKKNHNRKKECGLNPPLGVNMGTLMAETFKKMETAHTKDDEWGN